MLSAFVHSRPLLRALLALVLFCGLAGTAASAHVSLTSGHSVAAAIDTAEADLDSSGFGGTDTLEDNANGETLDVPDALTVHCGWLGQCYQMTAHATPLQWHASPELRPPNV